MKFLSVDAFKQYKDDNTRTMKEILSKLTELEKKFQKMENNIPKSQQRSTNNAIATNNIIERIKRLESKIN